MKLLDIRNNLAKISYDADEAIALGKFIALADKNHSYVAQIVNLKADMACNFAVAKLLFTFTPDGIVDNYDGTIPSLAAELSYLTSRDILALLPIEKPIVLGKLAQQDETLRVDETLFEKNLLICAEKFENICTLINNSVAQLNDKAVVIDTDHTFADYKSVRFKKDFKLPLNFKMIDYIYENDLDGVSPTSKAVIQDIFSEVQEYSKTIPQQFIPFDKFLDVVATQYEETKIPELALLKQKLLKYNEENIFAQNFDEINALQTAIQANPLTYVDITDVPDSLQQQLIEYVHSELDKIESYTYCFVKLTNHNSNKKLLRTLLDNNHVFTTVICSHNYKYVHELKEKAENIIFFAPQTLQHDFASYNTFLSKLGANEFVIYGALTQNIPFLVELAELSQDDLSEENLKEEQAEETAKDDITVEPEVFERTTNIDDLFAPKTEPVENLEEPIIEQTKLDELQIEEPVQNTASDDTIENLLADDNSADEISADNFFMTSNEPQTDLEPQIEELEPLTEEPKAEEPSFDADLSELSSGDIDTISYTASADEVPSLDEISDNVSPIESNSDEVLTENDLDFLDDLAENQEGLQEETPIEEEIITEEPELESIPTDYEVEETDLTEPTETSETIEVPEPVSTSAESDEATIDDLPDFSAEASPELEEMPEDLAIEDAQEELPIYPAEETVADVEFAQGDTVTHPKYGKGVVEKLIKYGNKTLCSIAFEDVGRRLLDPSISELQKVI